MPTFDTPEPVSASLEFDMGSVRIIASKRTDTVVEVLPSNGAEEADLRAVQQTKVSCTGGTVLVKGPKKRFVFGKLGSVDVTVELPAGSDVLARSALVDFVCTGPLGECLLKTSVGDIQVDEATTVNLKTDHGDVRLARVTGNAEISGAGRVEVHQIDGAAIVKNLNGETEIGEIVGELRANSSNGRISIGTAHAGVEARSANGHIRIGQVTRGQVKLDTASGDLEVGIRESIAAWLDVNTRLGSVRNSLGPSEGPGAAEDTVEVRAHTHLGDIVIRRA
ncbi:DUF4097 family beta strand repeat-containing protein [Streptomyces coffeae]|uniref:DUF4097 family beta strand repeat protein n=1 Tax=Streptomyces coffeae TaxID=621382 RepID=A0ABS1NJT0_9ACTN|nr:DUF4097 family beta strand repeat-containing protein [Streptomyces coffeae]MBL1100177.1 DUF4097 family beta strand repeat protein [Streptomyces coffeae]